MTMSATLLITIRVVLYEGESLSLPWKITSMKPILLFWRKSHMLDNDLCSLGDVCL